MWKENYRIGIDSIDQQHYALFQTVDHLMRSFQISDLDERKKCCRETLAFMMVYISQHFRDEEAYQASIGYSDLENHKRQHAEFTKNIHTYEKKFTLFDYDTKTIKEFAGMLVAWLIYHVAKEDQKLAKAAPYTPPVDVEFCSECFCESASEVLEKMVNVQTLATRKLSAAHSGIAGDIFVRIELVGDIKGTALFGFPKEMAFQIFKNMTFMDVSEIDELVCSAIAEIANIVSGNAATAMQSKGLRCDIKTPILSVGSHDLRIALSGIHVDTTLGNFEIAVSA